ncbi:DNA mismatch repair endonuclease MutL [bacterium]|nr:DNA mismatch repair endonuclease MutL [bacterium]
MRRLQMGNIVLLDDLTINKIAAGEVIERPASVIKEMVENSIDAGANNITVEIKNGGISFIKVTDNGKGIAQDDLEIAFERHATSKIRTADDLDVVTSMGFRGEALASIAAIANVEMVSKTEEQQVGYKVVVEAGEILSKEEIGCQKGTSITVRNLFFNTPVRYKFLKKDYTESGYIEDVITRIALVNPNIAIKLINTGKTVIQTNGNGDIKSVIYSIYGKDVATGVMPVEYAYDDIQISGVIGKPEIARSNRSNQLFFVNKRYIKDKTLSAATEQAYKGLIPIGKFGFVVLNITMNPAKVDVNVHPAKLEVRFEDESKIFQSIYHAIKDTLLKGELVASTEKQEINQNKEEVSKGLYDFRKNETEKIEQYTNEESKIKTNNIVQDIYNKAQQNVQTQAVKVPHVNLGEGGPVNTADVLEQLKKLQENIQKEVETDPSIKLNSNYIQMREQQGNQTKVETSVGNEVKVENNTDTENANILEQKLETPIEIKENTPTEITENTQIDDTKSNEIKPEETPEGKTEENQQEEAKPAENFDEMYAKLFGTKPISQEQPETKSNLQEEVIPIKPEIPSIDMKKENVSIFEQNEEYQKPTYKFIGIVFNTYIILEIDKEMYILDQHAAHERIMYEKVKNNYYSDSSKDSQMLLLPDIITLTHKEMEIAKDNMEMFEKAGFSLEEFGENTIKLTGVPTVCIDLDNKELFLETLDEINTVARTAKQEKEERFIATVACKAAVKANMVLTREEVESLMDKLLALPNPFTCPHGRPTAIKMSKYDIERKFARK